MRINVGDFGYRTPDGGATPHVTPEAFVQPGLKELGAAGMKVGQELAQGDQLDAQIAYREAHERRVEAEQQAKTIQRASATAKYQAFANDVYDHTRSVIDRVRSGELPTDKAEGELSVGVKQLREKHLDAVPVPLRAEVSNHMAAYGEAQRHALFGELDQRRKDASLASAVSLENELERLSQRDLDGAQRSYRQAVMQLVRPHLGEAQALKMIQSFDERTTYYNFAARMQEAGAARDTAALASIEGQIKDDARLDPRQKAPLLDHLGMVTAKAQGEKASDLEIAVGRGQAGYQQIEDAFHAGVITPAKRTDLTLHLDLARKKEQEKLQLQRNAITNVEAAIDGRRVLDFRSKDDRDELDFYYGSVVKPSMQRAGLDDAQRTQHIVNLVAQTGILPSEVKGEIRGALAIAYTPLSAPFKAAVADFLDRVKTRAPQVLNQFSDEDIRLANTISTYVRAGIAPLAAVDMAEKSLAVPAPEREAREKRYGELQKKDASTRNGKFLKDQLVGWRLMGSKPSEVPDGMVGEFEQLTREEFVRTGELEAAQRTALDHLRQVWGVSRASSDGKPRWMKYAPETVYHVADWVDDGWVREQLLKEAPRNAFVNEKQDLVLAADALTARETRPSYLILNRRDGVLEPIWKDGRPARFRPDFSSSPEGQRWRDEHDAQHRDGLKMLERERTRKLGRGDAAPERTSDISTPLLAP